MERLIVIKYVSLLRVRASFVQNHVPAPATQCPVVDGTLPVAA